MIFPLTTVCVLIHLLFFDSGVSVSKATLERIATDLTTPAVQALARTEDNVAKSVSTATNATALQVRINFALDSRSMQVFGIPFQSTFFWWFGCLWLGGKQRSLDCLPTVERLSRALTFPKTIFCPQKLLWGKFCPCVGHLLTIIPPLFHTTQSAVRAISQLFLSWTQKYIIVKKITTYSPAEALTSPLLLYSNGRGDARPGWQ